MLDHYRQHLVRLRRSQHTVRQRMVYVRQLVAAFPDPTKVKEQQLHGFVYSNPVWKEETINVVVSTMRSFYGWLETSPYPLKANPAVNLVTVSVPRGERPIVPDAVLVAAVASVDASGKALIMLGGEDGLRREEIATLHTRHRRGRRLTVTGKGNKTRVLLMSPELCEVLDVLEAGMAGGVGYYFPGRFGGGVHPATIYERTRRLLNYNTHAMRHRAITTVWRGSRDVFLTQKFAGHSSANTTSVYVHFDEEDLAEAAESARLANVVQLHIAIPLAA